MILGMYFFIEVYMQEGVFILGFFKCLLLMLKKENKMFVEIKR